MKRVSFLIAAFVFLVLSICSALSESVSAGRITAGEEWNWDPGAYNTFEGSIDLSEYKGQEIAVEMTTDLSYDTETEQDSMPVFTVVNGKRIVMLKQTNTIRCTPEKGSFVLDFSGRIRLPEKQRTDRIDFLFILTDSDGTQLKTVSCRLDNGDDTAQLNGSVFYIRFRTETVTLVLAIAAAAIWTIAVYRSIRTRNRNRTGV